MFGADATIVWVDRDSTPHAEDYYLSAYTQVCHHHQEEDWLYDDMCFLQCGGGVGACPDSLDSSGACSNDATLISGSINGREQCVVFSREFTAGIQTFPVAVSVPGLR